MEELFDFIKAKKIADLCGISPSRFSQKLHGHKIKGLTQKFSESETKKVKMNLQILHSELGNLVQNL